MKLTTSDYWSIAEQIEVGTGTIEFEKDGETLTFDYEAEEEGYREDDYFNGTGAWVTTYRSLSISNVQSFDEEGEDTENDFSETTLDTIYRQAA